MFFFRIFFFKDISIFVLQSAVTVRSTTKFDTKRFARSEVFTRTAYSEKTILNESIGLNVTSYD